MRDQAKHGKQTGSWAYFSTIALMAVFIYSIIVNIMISTDLNTGMNSLPVGSPLRLLGASFNASLVIELVCIIAIFLLSFVFLTIVGELRVSDLNRLTADVRKTVRNQLAVASVLLFATVAVSGYSVYLLIEAGPLFKAINGGLSLRSVVLVIIRTVIGLSASVFLFVNSLLVFNQAKNTGSNADSAVISERAEKDYARRPRPWIANSVWTVLLVSAIVFSFNQAEINWTRIVNLPTYLPGLLNELTNIQWDYLFGTFSSGFNFKGSIVYLMIETLAIAFFGTLIGAFFAIPFGFIASETIVGKKWSKVGETVLVVIRVFPEIVLAFVLIYGFGMNSTTGILTIGIHSVGMLGKMYAEAIDNMDRSALEALDAVGADTWQKIRFAVLPSIMPDFSSVTLYRFDINVRSSAILGVVSAGGIGGPLYYFSTASSWSNVGTILLAIVVTVILVDALSTYLRNMLVYGKKRSFASDIKELSVNSNNPVR